MREWRITSARQEAIREYEPANHIDIINQHNEYQDISKTAIRYAACYECAMLRALRARFVITSRHERCYEGAKEKGTAPAHAARYVLCAQAARHQSSNMMIIINDSPARARIRSDIMLREAA